MASGSFKQSDVCCPFYLFDDGRRVITCEGIVDKSNVKQSFKTRAGYELQMKVFCCEHFKNCEIYNMLMQSKYDEEED